MSFKLIANSFALAFIILIPICCTRIYESNKQNMSLYLFFMIVWLTYIVIQTIIIKLNK